MTSDTRVWNDADDLTDRSHRSINCKVNMHLSLWTPVSVFKPPSRSNRDEKKKIYSMVDEWNKYHLILSEPKRKRSNAQRRQIYSLIWLTLNVLYNSIKKRRSDKDVRGGSESTRRWSAQATCIICWYWAIRFLTFLFSFSDRWTIMSLWTRMNIDACLPRSNPICWIYIINWVLLLRLVQACNIRSQSYLTARIFVLLLKLLIWILWTSYPTVREEWCLIQYSFHRRISGVN